MYISVSYRNNMERIPEKSVDASTTTPLSFLADNGIEVGTRNLQVNGIPLTAEELGQTFESLISRRQLDANARFSLSAVAKGDGGII